MTPHIKRWITGIIAVPVLFAVIMYGSECVFTAFIMIISLGAVIEYNRMVFSDDYAW